MVDVVGGKDIEHSVASVRYGGRVIVVVSEERPILGIRSLTWALSVVGHPVV